MDVLQITERSINESNNSKRSAANFDNVFVEGEIGGIGETNSPQTKFAWLYRDDR